MVSWVAVTEHVLRCVDELTNLRSVAGITFTYAGLKTDNEARVLNNEGLPMPGLWAAGEISGGFFAFNYPGGAGLTKGAVFGRMAGRDAAEVVKSEKANV